MNDQGGDANFGYIYWIGSFLLYRSTLMQYSVSISTIAISHLIENIISSSLNIDRIVSLSINQAL